MWSETYRPNSLDEIIGQDHIIPRLRYMVERLHQEGDDGAFPHLMFAGQAGVGKTATAIALMKDLFGEDWKMNFIELNASDSRSISDIRTTVKDFSRRGVIGSYTFNGNQQEFPFNVVFLDECDHLTPDAQAALRRIMERFAKQTRFILSCNYPHRIIGPIKDRCAFADSRFHPIPSKAICEALRAVADREGLDIAPEALTALAHASRGSMRKALNLLFTATRVPSRVEKEDVRLIVNQMNPKKMRELLGLAIEANRHQDPIENQRIHRRIDSLIERFGERGLSGAEILDELYRVVAEDEAVPLPLRRRILESMGEALHYSSTSQDDLLSVKTFIRRVCTGGE